MISKFFPIGAPAKTLPFWIYLIFGNCPKGTKQHSLVLRSGRTSKDYSIRKKNP